MKEMLDRLIKREGGYVWHPNDRGGPTKYGITLATLKDWRGKECSPEDVAALTAEEAKQIYTELYWKRPRINELPVEIQEFMFDAAVNHGPARAVKMLQQIVGVTQDGIIGPVTLKAVQSFSPLWLLGELIRVRKEFYHSIVERDPSQAVFLNGWLNRLAEFEAQLWRLPEPEEPRRELPSEAAVGTDIRKEIRVKLRNVRELITEIEALLEKLT